jgi:hypothetical protein
MQSVAKKMATTTLFFILGAASKGPDGRPQAPTTTTPAASVVMPCRLRGGGEGTVMVQRLGYKVYSVSSLQTHISACRPWLFDTTHPASPRVARLDTRATWLFGFVIAVPDPASRRPSTAGHVHPPILSESCAAASHPDTLPVLP